MRCQQPSATGAARRATTEPGQGATADAEDKGRRVDEREREREHDHDPDQAHSRPTAKVVGQDGTLRAGAG